MGDLCPQKENEAHRDCDYQSSPGAFPKPEAFLLEFPLKTSLVLGIVKDFRNVVTHNQRLLTARNVCCLAYFRLLKSPSCSF